MVHAVRHNAALVDDLVQEVLVPFLLAIGGHEPAKLPIIVLVGNLLQSVVEHVYAHCAAVLAGSVLYMGTVQQLLNPAVIDLQEIVIRVILTSFLIPVQAEVFQIHAGLGGHEIGDNAFKVLPLDILPEGFFRDLPGKPDSGAAVVDLRGLHATLDRVLSVFSVFSAKYGRQYRFCRFRRSLQCESHAEPD